MSTKRITLIALFSAILCVLGPLSIPIGPISFSLTPFGVCLAAYVLGMRDGVISCLIYLLIGAIGLPVFSGFQEWIPFLRSLHNPPFLVLVFHHMR